MGSKSTTLLTFISQQEFIQGPLLLDTFPKDPFLRFNTMVGKKDILLGSKDINQDRIQTHTLTKASMLLSGATENGYKINDGRVHESKCAPRVKSPFTGTHLEL